MGEAKNRAKPLVKVEDPGEIERFQNESGRGIGVQYASPYHRMTVDLVRDSSGRSFAYEHLDPANDGEVVVVPLFKGKFVLLNQYRYIVDSYQLCFPRGFGEPGLTAQENASKELREEIGASVLPDCMTPLGTVTPDSGSQSVRVSVFVCEIDGYFVKTEEEQIEGIRVLDEEELRHLISDGEIEDSFTLSAYALWKCRFSVRP